ncbi:MAG: inositol-3-phosphate synthase [Myxococcota bacterium]
MNNRLGVCIIGSGGAVATTVIAGLELMKRGMAPRIGMVTETEIGQLLSMTKLDDIVVSGWDIKNESVYEACLRHGVIPRHVLDKVEEPLRAMKPWAAPSSQIQGDHMAHAKGYREELKVMEQDIANFKKANNLTSVVMVNLASTERYLEEADVHTSMAAFEAGLDNNDVRISPAMRYLYLAIKLGIPHANFTPSLSNVKALQKMSEEKGVPVAGEDGKTGQTLLKTVLAPAFVTRALVVDGWYSTNILGNNDGKILNDPASNKTKVVSKRGVLDDILGYKLEDHQVHIHYYRPRGDAKEAWDNIDILGFLGEPMQIKVNFLCKDSILAAPLVIDLVRLLDVAKQVGDRGIQKQLSLFFKSPYHTAEERPVHDLSKQYQLLKDWAVKVSKLQNKSAEATRSARG